MPRNPYLGKEEGPTTRDTLSSAGHLKIGPKIRVRMKTWKDRNVIENSDEEFYICLKVGKWELHIFPWYLELNSSLDFYIS